MDNKYDKLLIQGLTKLMDVEFSYVSEIQNVDYIFSNKYKRNKDKLIKNLGRSYWKFINTAAKKAAVIVVALTIALSSLMTVDAFREKIIGFVYKIYHTFTEVVSYNDSSNTHITTYYSVPNVPNNYSLYSINKDTAYRCSIYWVKNTAYIAFVQSIFSETNQFNSENGEISERIVNNTPCLICVDKNLYYCYWEFDGYMFELVYPTDLGEEFMSEVVGNLVEIDPEELEN